MHYLPGPEKKKLSTMDSEEFYWSIDNILATIHGPLTIINPDD
jgi:hypothetical protein